ncbi:MAG: NAD(P)-dependent oxidoreductase [Methanoregula sp.]
MKVLVTGGTGFLGSYIVKELVKSKTDVVVYDKNPPKNINMACMDSDHFTYINGDVLDYDAVYNAMKYCDIVIHTAAIANLDKARSLPVKTMEVNVVGTVNCLEAARNLGVKRFIYASSVYTAGKWGSFYRVSKQTGESLCKTFYEEFGLEYTIVRYGSLYGRDANEWNPIYKVLKALFTTNEYTYISSKDAVREYIHIYDAARETVRIAQASQFANKAVLITGHQKMKVEEFFSIIGEIIGKKIVIHYTPADKHKHYVMTPYSFQADISERVNLSTYIDISEGILDCLKEIQKELDQTKNE